MRKKNRAAVKGESRREKGGETEREDDRLRWWRRKSVVMWNARCESESERPGAKGETEWEGECRGNVTVPSPVTCTDVWGGEGEDWRIGTRTG